MNRNVNGFYTFTNETAEQASYLIVASKQIADPSDVPAVSKIYR